MELFSEFNSIILQYVQTKKKSLFELYLFNLYFNRLRSDEVWLTVGLIHLCYIGVNNSVTWLLKITKNDTRIKLLSADVDCA